MSQKGSAVVETAIVFPLLILLFLTLFFLFVRVISKEIEKHENEVDFMEKIHMTDSIKRKVEIINEVFQ